MKNNGNFKVLNVTPKLLISHYDLEAIKHIVAIAPQEAQWFHRCETIREDNFVYYRIYEMYIPEQYTSAAQVESDPMMMVKFFKELREEHGLDKTNEIMQNLTVWCHSHHNMGVGPSGQDVKQFAEQVKNAHDANVDLPQIMMIFNKKNTFYSKIYDPKLGLVFENVEIVTQGYDFSDISKQAKVKFKKRPVVKKPIRTNTARWSTGYTSSYRGSYSRPTWGWDNNDNYSFEATSEGNSDIDLAISDFLQDNETSSSSIDRAFKGFKPNGSKRDFVDKLVEEFNLVGLSAFKILISFDPGIIAGLPTSLDWIANRPDLPGLYEDIVNELEASTIDENLLKCAYIAAQAVEADIQHSADSNSGIIDLDSSIEPFLELVETIYQEEVSEEYSESKEDILDWGDSFKNTNLI